MASVAAFGLLLAGCATTVTDVPGDDDASIVVVGTPAEYLTPMELDGQVVSGTVRIAVDLDVNAFPEVEFGLDGFANHAALDRVGAHEGALSIRRSFPTRCIRSSPRPPPAVRRALVSSLAPPSRSPTAIPASRPDLASRPDPVSRPDLASRPDPASRVRRRSPIRSRCRKTP